MIPTNYRTQLGQKGLQNWGRGNDLQSVPQPQWLKFHDFSQGYVSQNARSDIPRSAFVDALDLEIDRRDRVFPVAGTTLVENFGARVIDQVALHANLDGGAELVFFDAPFIGVKREGATVWTDVGLPAGPHRWTWTNFGSTLLFSNRRLGLYARQPGEAAVTLLDGAPAAATYASFAGRVFAGGAIIDGNFEALGVRWSAADSDYTDWDGIGAGAELLIDDLAQGDEVVALRTMGLDFLMVGCRKSIWVGRRTGLAARPADFRPQVPGVGFVNEQCVHATRFGVIGLSDIGVILFDGQQAQVISEQINADLLPLDDTQLENYHAKYNPFTARYSLHTPTGTWVYDIEKRRWYKRSLVCRAEVLFSTQVAGKKWGELVGTWGAQTGTWADFKGTELDDFNTYFLGGASGSTDLVVEDEASSENFGVVMLPVLELPLTEGDFTTQILTMQKLLIRYVSEESSALAVYLQKLDETVQTAGREVPLAAKAQPFSKVTNFHWAGAGQTIRVEFTSGKPRVDALEFLVLPGGPRIEPVVRPRLSLVEEGLIETLDFTAMPNGAFIAPAGWRNERGADAVAPYIQDGRLVCEWGPGNRHYNLVRGDAYIDSVICEIIGEVGADGFNKAMHAAMAYNEGDWVPPDEHFWSGDTTQIWECYPWAADLTEIGYVSEQWVGAGYYNGYGRSEARPALGVLIAAKIWVTIANVQAWSNGGAFTLRTNNAPVHKLPNWVGLNSAGIGAGELTPVTYDRIARINIFKSNEIRVRNLPTGYKIVVGAVTVASTGAYETTIDGGGAQSPWNLEIRNVDDDLMVTWPISIWGGTILNYSE